MKRLVSILAACGAMLWGCGGSDGSRPTFTRLVSFGDSLSDVGSYKVGTVAALGGGRYTVNDSKPGVGPNWTELLASQLALPAPCAAVTGLDGDASRGFKVPATPHPGCTSYGQGGSRVTNPVGPGNKLLGGGNATLGQLTIPLVTQMTSHLAATGGAYKEGDLVTVLSGGNDLFINLATMSATVAAGGNAAAAAATAIAAMATAGDELASAVKSLILAKGAQHVVVVLLADASLSPFGNTFDPTTRSLIMNMTIGFNDRLAAGLAGTPVLIVDAYTIGRDQVQNPAKYGLSNVSVPACDLSPAKNPLGSSLVCSAANVIPGDVSRYGFADMVHPTPYGYELIRQLVVADMRKIGWLQ